MTRQAGSVSFSTNSTEANDDKIIRNLRSQGYSIPLSISTVLYSRDPNEDLEEIKSSCVLMEGGSILAIILFDSFTKDTEDMVTTALDKLYPLSGTLKMPWSCMALGFMEGFHMGFMHILDAQKN